MLGKRGWGYGIKDPKLKVGAVLKALLWRHTALLVRLTFKENWDETTIPQPPAVRRHFQW